MGNGGVGNAAKVRGKGFSQHPRGLFGHPPYQSLGWLCCAPTNPQNAEGNCQATGYHETRASGHNRYHDYGIAADWFSAETDANEAPDCDEKAEDDGRQAKPCHEYLHEYDSLRPHPGR